jgi:hypothetical protein
MARRKGKKGKGKRKNIQIHPAEILITVNALEKLGFVGATSYALNGDLVGAANFVQGRMDMGHMLDAALPAVAYGFVKPMIAGRVPKIALGGITVHAL